MVPKGRVSQCRFRRANGPVKWLTKAGRWTKKTLNRIARRKQKQQEKQL